MIKLTIRYVYECADEELVHQPSWTVSLDRLAQKIAGRWRSFWQVLSQYSGAAVRLHLALFYFYGLYYHWSKRATGKVCFQAVAALHLRISCAQFAKPLLAAPGSSCTDNVL